MKKGEKLEINWCHSIIAVGPDYNSFPISITVNDIAPASTFSPPATNLSSPCGSTICLSTWRQKSVPLSERSLQANSFSKNFTTTWHWAPKQKRENWLLLLPMDKKAKITQGRSTLQTHKVLRLMLSLTQTKGQMRRSTQTRWFLSFPVCHLLRPWDERWILSFIWQLHQTARRIRYFLLSMWTLGSRKSQSATYAPQSSYVVSFQF